MIDRFDTELVASEAALLPGQITGGHRLDAELSGERALMLAILEDAVRCILQGHGRRPGRWAASYRLRALASDAAAWMRVDDRAWLFSFVNICDLLGFDADAVRARVLSSEQDSVPGRPGAYGDRAVASGGLPPHRGPRSAAA